MAQFHTPDLLDDAGRREFMKAGTALLAGWGPQGRILVRTRKQDFHSRTLCLLQRFTEEAREGLTGREPVIRTSTNPRRLAVRNALDYKASC